MVHIENRVSAASERAIAILDANSRVPYGLFGVVVERGRFPPRPFLNDFLLAGADPGDPKRRGACWTPLALNDDDYVDVERWWLANHPEAVTDGLGAGDFAAWQLALLEGDWGDSTAVPAAAAAIGVGTDDDEDFAAIADRAAADVDDPDPEVIVAAVEGPADPPVAKFVEGALDQPCPCCGARTIAPWRKFRVWSAVGGRCRACHRVWGVSSLAPLGALAMLAPAAVGYTLVHHTPRLVAVVGAAAMFGIVAVFVLVPAVRR